MIKEIDTGVVYEDDAIDPKLQNSRLSSDDLHLLADPKLFAKHIKKLEVEMNNMAKQLQFEQAAKMRDEINRLKSQLLH